MLDVEENIQNGLANGPYNTLKVALEQCFAITYQNGKHEAMHEVKV